MGKRKKAAAKPTGKKNEPLPTVFPCLFCNHEKSVVVKMEKKQGVGSLSCKRCNQQFQCAVNYLSAPVDVYADWIDACDAVAKEDGGEEAVLAPSRAPEAGRPKLSKKRTADDDDDDGMLDDGSEAGSGYGGDGIVADDEY